MTAFLDTIEPIIAAIRTLDEHTPHTLRLIDIAVHKALNPQFGDVENPGALGMISTAIHFQNTGPILVPCYSTDTRAIRAHLPASVGCVMTHGRVTEAEPLGGALITSLDGSEEFPPEEGETMELAFLSAALIYLAAREAHSNGETE